MARKFGVEIEWEGNLQAVIDALTARGIAVTDARHTHSTGIAPSNWTVKRDGSIARGGELVSPPLDFDLPAHKQQVIQSVLALQDAGAKTAGTAGIHVHIEARNNDGSQFTGKQVGSVVRFCYKFEDAIYRIASSGWDSIRPGARSYAKPLEEPVARAIMKARTHDDIQKVWNGRDVRGRRNVFFARDRYTAVNLHSYFYRETIEFRHFNSSLNPIRIWTYIAFCMAIVDDARAGHSRSVKKSYPLGWALSQPDPDEAARKLFLRLQQVLRSNSRDTEVLMSEEDWKNLRKICWKGSRSQAAF